MNTQEAVEQIETLISIFHFTEKDLEALDLAIKALNTMPFVHDMSNTIDRLRKELGRND